MRHWQANDSALWTKSMWAHGCFNKTKAAWLVKILMIEQPIIKLAMYRSSLSDGFSTVENWMHLSWLHYRTTLVCSTNSKREGSGELCIQAVSCRTVQCGTITLQYFVKLHDCLSSNSSLWKWWELGILSAATEAVKTFRLYFLGSVLTLQVNSRVHYLISSYIIQLIAFQ